MDLIPLRPGRYLENRLRKRVWIHIIVKGRLLLPDETIACYWGDCFGIEQKRLAAT